MSKPTHALVKLKENGEYDPFKVPIEYSLVELTHENIENLIGAYLFSNYNQLVSIQSRELTELLRDKLLNIDP